MIQPYEQMVLQLLNSKTFVPPSSLYAEIRTDMATLLSEKNDCSGTEPILLRFEDKVET